MQFSITELDRGAQDHLCLWKKCQQDFSNFLYFDSQFKGLVHGNYKVLKNQFSMKRLMLRNNDEVRVAGIFFEPRADYPSTIPASIGALVAKSDLTDLEAQEFWQGCQRELPNKLIVAPLNGHHYLGFAYPLEKCSPNKVGIATSSSHPGLDTLFKGLQVYRKYFSLETKTTSEMVDRFQHTQATIPQNFSVRKFRPSCARKDLDIMNEIVNEAFVNHFDFAPLTNEENWDIMRWGLPILEPGHLVFLMHEKKEIGFCLGMIDYNQVFKHGHDLKNAMTLAARRFKLSAPIKRARIIHVGLKKDYQGKGIVKYLRHDLFYNLIKGGAVETENSYIDEGNSASLNNVQSTGAAPLHAFALFKING